MNSHQRRKAKRHPRQWCAWLSEYPEEGSMMVEGACEADALIEASQAFGEDAEPIDLVDMRERFTLLPLSRRAASRFERIQDAHEAKGAA